MLLMREGIELFEKSVRLLLGQHQKLDIPEEGHIPLPFKQKVSQGNYSVDIAISKLQNPRLPNGYIDICDLARQYYSVWQLISSYTCGTHTRTIKLFIDQCDRRYYQFEARMKDEGTIFITLHLEKHKVAVTDQIKCDHEIVLDSSLCTGKTHGRKVAERFMANTSKLIGPNTNIMVTSTVPDYLCTSSYILAMMTELNGANLIFGGSPNEKTIEEAKRAIRRYNTELGK